MFTGTFQIGYKYDDSRRKRGTRDVYFEKLKHTLSGGKKFARNLQ